jgi:hypothetical protein
MGTFYWSNLISNSITSRLEIPLWDIKVILILMKKKNSYVIYDADCENMYLNKRVQ